MEKIIQNIICIIVFIFLCVFISSRAYSYHQDVIAKDAAAHDLCKLYENYDYPGKEEYCQKLEDGKISQSDFYYMLYNLTSEGINPLYIVGIIVVSSSIYASLFYNNKKNIDKIKKEDYKKLQKNLLCNTYKIVLSIMGASIFALILSFIYNKGFTCNIFLETYATDTFINNPYIFIPLYLLNVIIHTSLFASMTYLVIRKFPNIIISSALSFAILFVIEVVYEILVEGIIFNFALGFHLSSFFSIYNFLPFQEAYGGALGLVSPSITLIIILILIYIFYKNKESLITDLEKEKESIFEGLKITK